MDTTTVVIALSATVLFFAVLIYKAVWLIRKVQQAPEDAQVDAASADQAKKAPEAEPAQTLR